MGIWDPCWWQVDVKVSPWGDLQWRATGAELLWQLSTIVLCPEINSGPGWWHCTKFFGCFKEFQHTLERYEILLVFPLHTKWKGLREVEGVRDSFAPSTAYLTVLRKKSLFGSTVSKLSFPEDLVLWFGWDVTTLGVQGKGQWSVDWSLFVL